MSNPVARRNYKREADNLRDAMDHLRLNLQKITEAAGILEDRAVTAEATVGVMREQARTLWEAVYKGKITEPLDLLQALERIIHA